MNDVEKRPLILPFLYPEFPGGAVSAPLPGQTTRVAIRMRALAPRYVKVEPAQQCLQHIPIGRAHGRRAGDDPQHPLSRPLIKQARLAGYRHIGIRRSQTISQGLFLNVRSQKVFLELQVLRSFPVQVVSGPIHTVKGKSNQVTYSG